MSAALDMPKRGGNGGVSQLRRHLTQLAASDPEAIRTEIIARGREPFISGIVDTLAETSRYCHACERHGKERWAFRLYAELAKLVGSAPEITLQIMALVGAQPAVARSAVETQRAVSDMTRREQIESAVAWLREEGCTVEMPPGWSTVEVVNGNGERT